jgi:hypothetical protein
MTDQLQDSAILEQERWPIELLARETNTAIARVEEVFLEEYKKLAQGAHIMAFVPLLTGNVVRKRLTDQNAGRAEVSNP